MRYTTELLKTISDINISNDDIVDLINTHIGNVEYSHDISKDYEGIVVAEIVEKKDHPDADKLGVYKVFTGEETRHQVVAGDKTLEIGDKVAYIKPDSIVPYSIYEEEPFVIKAIKLRGVDSNGMLGSEKELNIGPNHDHVMRLPSDAIPGTPFAEYYSFNDFVVSVENKALTNRGDLFGLVGMARELVAITGERFESPAWYRNQKKNIRPEQNCLSLDVVNDAEALCPRYTAIAMDNITNEESPTWLKSALLRLDVKPTNSIVDITNYVSALFGQPLHAFDYDKIINTDPATNNKVTINVRMARDNEKILGLDNKIHELNDRVIVIADNTNPIAIAGVMGGRDTSVDENTKRIVFESANFDKNSIRRTSMDLGLNTDAATKYKHSLDTEACIPALLKAVELTKEITGGQVASEVIDIYEEPYQEQLITINIERLNIKVGLNLKKEEVEQLLLSLEYKVKSKGDGFLTVIVPSWRRDVAIEEDIYEDVARIYGYNNIDIRLPHKDITPLKDNKIFNLKKEIRKTLSDLGANEILTYSFTSESNFQKSNLDLDKAFVVKNAISPELKFMRTSLLQSILSKCKENIQRGFEEFGLFELNIPHIKGYIDENSLPKEDWHLSCILNKNNIQDSGSAYYWGKKYLEKVLNTDKCNYVLIADSLEQDLPEDVKVILPMFDPNTSAICFINGTAIGIVGEFTKSVKEEFKLSDYSCGIDVNLNRLLELDVKRNQYLEVPIYPTFSLDFSFETKDEIGCQSMISELERILNDKESWARVECIDIYKSPNMKNVKRTTLRVIASKYDRTASDKDIKKISEKVIKDFERVFDAKVI